MKTRKEALQVWADRWRDLKAWGRPLEEVDITLRDRSCEVGAYSTGVAYPAQRRSVVTAGSDIPDALATILHELAHLAAPGHTGHGQRWLDVYAKAASEVTGTVILADVSARDLNQLVEAAMDHWWQRSGNAFTYSLLFLEA